MNHIEDVHQLTLVFVDSFDLDVDQGVLPRATKGSAIFFDEAHERAFSLKCGCSLY